MPNKKRKPILPMTQERIDTFWSHVDKSNPDRCWPWIAGRDTLGYGVFQVQSTRGWNNEDKRSKKCIRVHRIAFALSNGYDPIGLVCHKCDNPPCCNPEHLFEGTDTDNVWDMYRKNRANNVHARLTLEQVAEIEKLYPPPSGKARPRGKYRSAEPSPKYADIAIQYRVNSTTIMNIANRKTWKYRI